MDNALEVIRILVGVNPSGTETEVSLGKGGIEFLNTVYGITEEEIKNLLNEHIKKSLITFAKELSLLKNKKVECKLKESSTEDLGKELQESLSKLVAAFLGEVK